MAQPLSPAHANVRRSRLSSLSSNAADNASLRAFVRDSDCIIQHTIRGYAKFVRQCADGSINTLHKRVGVDHGLYLYEEKCETATNSSFVHQICPGAFVSAASASGVDNTRSPFSRVTKLDAFGGGEITGTLDDVMRGVHAETDTDHTINGAVQFGVENVLDSGIVETFERCDAAHPYRYFGVKWVEVATETNDNISEISDASESIGSPINELNWIERTGIYTTKSGHQYGYHLLKTVDSDYRPQDPLVRSVHMSVCYLYNQVRNDIVHVFLRGIIELPHTPNADTSDVLAQASQLMLAPARARQCQRMRIILEMIEKSKTDRSQLLACRCSTVLRGLPRVDLCSDCREVMQQCKLLTIHEAPQRKQAQHGMTRVLQSSTSTTNSVQSAGPSSSRYKSAKTSPRQLATERGTVRQDGQLMADVDLEVLSYRMLLPIQETRPSSLYRQTKKARGNVLLEMLLKYEDERRQLAADFVN